MVHHLFFVLFCLRNLGFAVEFQFFHVHRYKLGISVGVVFRIVPIVCSERVETRYIQIED